MPRLAAPMRPQPRRPAWEPATTGRPVPRSSPALRPDSRAAAPAQLQAASRLRARRARCRPSDPGFGSPPGDGADRSPRRRAEPRWRAPEPGRGRGSRSRPAALPPARRPRAGSLGVHSSHRPRWPRPPAVAARPRPAGRPAWALRSAGRRPPLACPRGRPAPAPVLRAAALRPQPVGPPGRPVSAPPVRRPDPKPAQVQRPARWRQRQAVPGRRYRHRGAAPVRSSAAPGPGLRAGSQSRPPPGSRHPSCGRSRRPDRVGPGRGSMAAELVKRSWQAAMEQAACQAEKPL